VSYKWTGGYKFEKNNITISVLCWPFTSNIIIIT